jgi:predicted RNase H-like HicB family nuclease
MACKNDCYTYRLTWSAEDKEHVGLCVEFPSLSWLAESPEEALRGIREVVRGVVADMKAYGETVPEPLALKQFSGKLSLRLPPEVHRNLAIAAAEARISINRLVNSRLTI